MKPKMTAKEMKDLAKTLMEMFPEKVHDTLDKMMYDFSIAVMVVSGRRDQEAIADKHLKHVLKHYEYYCPDDWAELHPEFNEPNDPNDKLDGVFWFLAMFFSRSGPEMIKWHDDLRAA